MRCASSRSTVLVGGLILLLGACADPEGETVPSVEILGGSGVLLGETLQLGARTNDGVDSAYTWASGDETIATVDATGLVSALGVGETVITATGVDTGLSGSHNVVVIPSTVIPDTTDDTAGDTGEPPADVVEDTGPVEPSILVPYYEQWVQSGHADYTAEAFIHWDEEDPAVVPASCAQCHSTAGYQDYLGADGSTPFQVDAGAPVGSAVECAACHNTATQMLDTVIFPSGVEISGLGPEARCMTCHQGRASTDSVDAAIAAAAVADDDTVGETLNFQNIHYYAAGATIEAGRVRGGYQYEGQVYDWRFRHVPGFDSCVGCHDVHTLELKLDKCQTCHEGVDSAEKVKDIRMIASKVSDYDGDGDKTEGIWFELDGLRTLLLEAMADYGATQAGLSAICYSEATYPYWFVDTDGNAECSAEEASFANSYKTWTPRMLRAAYNYQVALKDPGAHAHNAKYIIQLLHDSIADLNEKRTNKLDLTKLDRNDPGHFNGAGEAARHWDEDTEVSASCSKCHGGSEGFHFYLEYGVGKEVEEQDNGLDCATCHTSFAPDYDVFDVAGVTFPSGKTVSVGNGTSNMCGTCHSAREAGNTVDAYIAAQQAAGKTLSFRNPHYYPAAATLAGSDAAVGYQYEGKTYDKTWKAHPPGTDCTVCHNPVATNHSFDANDNLAGCTGCHAGITELTEIRGSAHTGKDYDGDGVADESLAGELEGLAEAVYKQLQAVGAASTTAETNAYLCYNGNRYPYFFVDTNKNGTCDGDEGSGYTLFTPAMLRAAFNYQFALKDPGAWAHNFEYMAQLLFDSVENLGGNTTTLGLKRP